MTQNPNTKLKLQFLGMLILTFIWSSIGGYGLGRYTAPTPYIKPCPDAVTEFEDLLRNYEYDRVIISAKDSNGNDFALKVHLSRRQIGKNLYQHYYSGYSLINEETNVEWKTKDLGDIEIAPIGFVENFNRTQPIDGTAQQKLDIDLVIEDNIINLKSDLLVADFIVKSSPDYTRYESIGDVQIALNGDLFFGQIFLDKIIARDTNKLVHAERIDELDYTSYSIALWDESKNFYLVDITDVQNPDPDIPYDSHSWILYKDKEGKFTKKVFNAELEHEVNEDMLDIWKISIPELDNTQIELTASTYLEYTSTTGLLEGTIMNDTNTLPISGHFSYRNQESTEPNEAFPK